MRNRFFSTVFTPSVQAEQQRHGSRATYAKYTVDKGAETGALLSDREIDFVRSRDSFYLATVSESGWPHVQHRGGPVGFVRASDSMLIWADYAGNRQYVSIGNSASNDRAALILVDYPRRARLKILGRLRSFESDEQPDLVLALTRSDYRGRIEHIMQLTIEAFDWNCPQHITPRYTLAEIEAGRVNVANKDLGRKGVAPQFT